MTTLNRQQWLGIAAISGLLLLVVDQFARPALARLWKEKAHRIADLRRSVNDGELLLQRQDTITARWSQMRSNLLAADRSTAERQLLKAFDRWSQESRISVTSIKPQWKRTLEDQETLECRVDAAGNLSAITRFLHSIEKDPLAVRVDSVELTSRDDGGEQLTLGLQVNGLLAPPEPSSGPAANNRGTAR